MTVDELINILNRSKDFSSYKITEDQVDKAIEAISLNINNQYDALYFFSAMNLLNAYVKLETARAELFQNYFFKKAIIEVLIQLFNSEFEDIEIYVNSKVCYIKIFAIQFSFHNIGAKKYLSSYLLNKKNQKQKWSGIKLQVFSGLIFNFAEQLRTNSTVMS